MNSRQQTLILLFVLTFASAFSKVILTKNIPRTTVHYHKVKKNGWSLCQRGVAFGKNLWEGQAKEIFFNQFWASAIEWEISRTWYLTRKTYGQGCFGPSVRRVISACCFGQFIALIWTNFLFALDFVDLCYFIVIYSVKKIK